MDVLCGEFYYFLYNPRCDCSFGTCRLYFGILRRLRLIEGFCLAMI